MATSEQWLKLWEDGFHHHHHHNEGDQQKSSSAPLIQVPSSAESGEKRASGPGCHGTAVDKYLQKHIGSLTGGKDNLSILVTLCGNSPDLAWLCEKGYNVVGCELSAKAVEQLFENRVLGGKIDYQVSEEGGIKTYTATDGKKLKVYVGDFFSAALSPELTGTFDCIWDCHGIISVPATLHAQYADKVSKFLKPGGRMLFSTLDSVDAKETAPVPISAARLSELFPAYSVELLEDPESTWHTQRCGGNWTNPVTLFTRKD